MNQDNTTMANENPVTIGRHQTVGEITINYPPVNALSTPVRAGLLEGIEQLEADEQVTAIVIRCQGKTFIAGADIKEFGRPPEAPFLPDVVNRIARCKKPVVAALFGTALGGGLEVALACHYRVALTSARVGLPEVNLGLIPGAGGTQRLPKIVGVEKAIEMISSGQHYSVASLQDSGLFDLIVESDLTENSRRFAETLSLPEDSDDALGSVIDALDWSALSETVAKRARGAIAPVAALEMMREALKLPVEEGMKLERSTFLKLRESTESAALRHAFAAEKAAAKTPFKTEPLPINRVGIVGGGNMGSGIATAFLNSGFSVRVIEQNREACLAAKERIIGNLSGALARGKLTQQAFDEQVSRLHLDEDKSALSDVDLVIEAVFESLEVKQTLFAELNQICRPDCLFATNTSYLDINTIAEASGRAEQLVGMHFFSPAHLMKLLEVVRAEKSSEQALQTAMAVGKRLRKLAVMVGVCFGFAGNRMYTRYGREIQQMLLEGAGIGQIDRAMKSFGMAMGPLAVQDLSGIDIGHSARSTQPFPAHDPGYFRAAAAMVEAGRLGRKTGAGFYRYVDGKMLEDDAAEAIIADVAAKLGIARRQLQDEEIQHRALMALISEGLALFQQGIVQRLSDIDVIWLNGYGFPRHKGGPMFIAKQLGADTLAKEMQLLRERHGEQIWPELDWTSINQS